MTSDSASRVTRSRRSLQRSLLVFAAVLAGVTVLRAQEPPPAAAPTAPAPPPVTAAEAPATSPAAAGDAPPAPAPNVSAGAAQDVAAGADAEAAAAKEGKPTAKVGPTRDRFEPTEKVRADFDVSFPVDI